MRSSTRVTMAAAAVAAGAVLAAPAAAATTEATTTAMAPVSRIYAASQHTCLDVTTTSGPFGDTYGHRCDGAPSQAFTFHPLATGPANTYEITSQSTGQCIDQYRFGIRQESCTGLVPPDYTNVEWTLQRVGTTKQRYQFVVTTTVGSTSPRCVTVYPTPNGYPGPLFDFAACSGSPSQVLTLTTAP